MPVPAGGGFAIDEHGIVRQVEPTLEKFEKEFIDKKIQPVHGD
jgi:hypothetical protein